MTFLRIDHLLKRFGGLAAVDDCSLEVHEGELHALIGPNGAGKTTLINLLAGELSADGGRIELAGRDNVQLYDTFQKGQASIRKLGDLLQTNPSVAQKPEVDLQFEIFRKLYQRKAQVSTHTQIYQVVNAAKFHLTPADHTALGSPAALNVPAGLLNRLGTTPTDGTLLREIRQLPPGVSV